jgi:glycosyltransferase involved in cell wall biosynthesis
VVSDVGGFSEVAETGAACLVAPGDAGALAAVLSGLLGDASERRRLSDAARVAASGPYSWTEIARRTLALYEHLSAMAQRGQVERP